MLKVPSSPQQAQSRKAPAVKHYFDHKTNDSMTALHYFCRSGSHHTDIKTMIEIQPHLVSCPTRNGGDTPLHFSVAANDLKTALLLLETLPSAASVKSRPTGNFGCEMTPLHVALSTQASVSIIKALVRASPRSLKSRDGNGRTPQQLACENYEGRLLSQILACMNH